MALPRKTPLTIDYQVLRAGNSDTEREQLNRILADIRTRTGLSTQEVNTLIQEALANLPPPPGGGSGGQVDSIVAGDGIDVDSSDPVNPEVSVALSTDVGNQAAFGTDGGVFVPASGGGGDGGVILNIGDVGGVTLATGDRFEMRLLSGYEFDDWRLDITPTGSATVEVEINGSSISTGGNPAVSSSTTATGDTTSWAGDSGVQDDLIAMEILSLTGAIEKVTLSLYGVKV